MAQVGSVLKAQTVGLTNEELLQENNHMKDNSRSFRQLVTEQRNAKPSCGLSQ